MKLLTTKSVTNRCKYAFMLACIFSCSLSYAELVVIVHPSQDIGSVSKSDISRVFLGKTKTLKGKGVTPVNQNASSDSRKAFDNDFLGKTPQQMKAYWSKQLFSGNGSPPKEKAGDIDILVHVSENKKAIGYIDKSALNPSVKQLTIQ